MSLDKLRALHSYLMSKNLVDANQIDSYMENGRLIPANKYLGNGYVICRFEYDAVFLIERFTKGSGLLLAIICAWLVDNDDNRTHENMPPPDIEVDIVDDRSADVEITIKFREDITLVRDDLGLIDFNGNTYSLSEVTPDIVDEAAVGDLPTPTADKSYKHGDPIA